MRSPPAPRRFLGTLVGVLVGVHFGALLLTSAAAHSQSAEERVNSLELQWWAEDAVGGVFDLARTADGMMWAATGDGLLRLDGSETVRFVPGGDSPQPVRAVEPDASGTLVVALDHGAYRFDGRRFVLLSRPGVGGRPWAAKILLLDQDRTLWVGAADTLLRLSPEAFSLRQGLPGVSVSLLWEDPFGYLWATTESGQVFRRLGNAFQPVNFPLGMGDSPVHCLHLDSEGWLWLVRSDGAFKVDGDFAGAGLPRQARPFEALEGLAVRTCISESDRGLWLGTERGLLHQAADGSRAKVPGLDGAVRSILSSPDGNLWVATENGLAQLHDPSTPAPLPSVLVTGATVDGKEVPLNDRFDLAPGAGTLRLTFSAPSFRHPAEARVRYRWGENDRGTWIELGGNELLLDDLPAGDSQLTLQAGLDEQWNAPGTKIQIYREPAIWQTRAFWGALGAGVGALLIWLSYLRWLGTGHSPLEMQDDIDDDDIVHLEDLDTDELKVSQETVERARRNIFRDPPKD